MEQETELNEKLESLYDFWEETQALIRSRLEALKCQHGCDGQRWPKRFQFMDQVTAFSLRVLPPEP